MTAPILFLLLLTTTTFGQVVTDPITNGQPIVPSPGGSSTTTTITTVPDVPGATDPAPAQATTQTQTTVQPAARPATKAEIDAAARVATRAGMSGGAEYAASETIGLAQGGLGMGDWLLTRDPAKVLDYKPVQDMNNMLRWAGLGVWIICIGLVLLKHVLGPFVNTEPAMLYLALPLTFAAGIAGFFNRELLLLIVTCAHSLLGIIANGALKEALAPGLRIADLPAPSPGQVVSEVAGSLTAPIVALVLAVVSLLLVLKMWGQVAWLFILTAVAPLYVTVTGAPLLGRYGSQWWRAWFGTLIDPILTIAGLRVAAAGLGFLDGNQPQFWDQVMTLALLLPLLATPGWHAGAYGGNGVDWLLGLLVYRVLLRQQPRQVAQTPQTPPWIPSILPNPAAVAGGPPSWPGGGTGGGNAASWWKTARWSPAGWTTMRAAMAGGTAPAGAAATP